MGYHLGFAKFVVSIEEFKSDASLEENCKCPLESVNPSVKLENLVWKPWYSGILSLVLKLEESGCRLGCVKPL